MQVLAQDGQMPIPAFIIARDRFTMIKNTVEQVQRLGCVPVIVDNASTYPPLLEWYSEVRYNVVRLGDSCQGKFPHRNVWTYVLPSISIFQHRWNTDYYVVTDPDLDLSDLPSDTLEKLKIGLNKGLVHKCGLSLEISNCHPEWQDKVVAWERQFWDSPVYYNEQIYYSAPIDTTFALYNIYNAFDLLTYSCHAKALRIGFPYSVMHIPWHVGKADWTEEDKYYYEHMNKAISWTFSPEEEYNGNNESVGHASEIVGESGT